MLFFMDPIVRQNSKVLKIWIAGDNIFHAAASFSTFEIYASLF